MSKLNFVSYNVHGLNHPIKSEPPEKLQCSIALLQETHLVEWEYKKLVRDWVGQEFHAAHGKTRGVTILVNKSTIFTAEKVIRDDNRRYVMLVSSIGDTPISINVNAPNEEKEMFFKEVANVVNSNGKGMIVLGGDFNVIQNSRLDRLPSELGPA